TGAQAGEDTVEACKHLLRYGRRRQAGDDSIAALRHRLWGIGPMRAAGKQWRGCFPSAIVDGERETRPQQTACQRSAEMTEADEAVTHEFAPSDGAHCRGCSGDEDDLAGEGLAEEFLLGLHDLAQRKGLPYDRLDLAALDVADEVTENGGIENRAAKQA